MEGRACDHIRCASHPARCEYVSRIISPEKRFWSKVNKNGPVIRPELGPCWVWTANRLPSGYGRFWPNASEGKIGAHRFSFLLAFGVDPGDLDVCHRCDNPPCVRPDHLFLGTATDNGADMVAKGRHAAATHPESMVRGERQGHAKLTTTQVLEIKERLAMGETCDEIAADYSVSRSAISLIKIGRNWKWLASDREREQSQAAKRAAMVGGR